MISNAEIFIIGVVIFAHMVLAMQIKKAMDRGEHLMTDPTGINPLDYLFREMPEGTYSTNQPFKKAIMWSGVILDTVGSGWIAVNVPEWSMLGIIYVLMSLIVAIVFLVEEIAPKRSEATGAMLFGYGKWDEQILIGLVAALPFIVINVVGECQLFQVMQIKGMVIGSFIVTAFIVPTVEEATFRGVVAPSIAEDAGIVHGALISAFMFAVFHAYAFHYNYLAMFVVFVFGTIVGFIDLYYKSILPGLAAHAAINTVAYFSWLFAP